MPGLGGDDVSYRGQFDYNGDRYGVQAERLVVGGDFSPEVGFIRRADDFDRRFAMFRFSPRPERIDAVRKFTVQGQVAYVLDRADVLETRENQGQFGIEFENSDTFNLTYTDSYEFLKQPFPIAPGVTIPVGGYTFQDAQVSYTIGPRCLHRSLLIRQPVSEPTASSASIARLRQIPWAGRSRTRARRPQRYVA